MTALRRALVGGACALLLVAEAAGQAGGGAPGGLTGLPGLKRAYDAILNAQFPRAAGALAAACGPAPREACDVLEATSLWWQILQDPHSTRLDAAFSREANQAIEAAERWTGREPDRAEAWFYLGAAYGARVSWRVARGERLAAARDGKRIKDALERALALDPTFDDARFGIGLYKYYADVAPAAAKILRFLLLLPGGDRTEGLADMQATEARGQLVAGEALYQLHWIYVWYEQQPARGLAALERLHSTYPANPHFLQRIAEVRVDYFHDAARSLAAWRRLTAAAPASGDPQIAEVRGRLGAAEQLDALFETDRALPELQRVVALAPSRPYGAAARAQLLLGRALDRLGRRNEAVAAYTAALALVPEGDPDGVRAQARDGVQHRPDASEADAYRLSLEGWRAFEQGNAPAALDALARARTLAPDDAMIRMREARVMRKSRPADAARAFDEVIARRRQAAPVALSAALLWSAELLEERGERAGALERYRAATRVFAGDSRMSDRARRAVERLK